MKDPFDTWLEKELATSYSRLGKRPAPPFSAGRLPRLRLALPAALGAKAATGLAIAALAAGGGAVAVVKAGGPVAFGQTVSDRAAACAAASSIGDCVSDFVVDNNPGASHRSSNAQPGAATHGQSTAPGQLGTSGHVQDSHAGHGAAAPHPTGKPTPRGNNKP